jgi:hypothetical protein
MIVRTIPMSFRGAHSANFGVHCTPENLEIPGLILRTIPE